MIRKTILLFTILLAGVVAGGFTSKMFAWQSGRPIPMPAPNPQPSPSATEPPAGPTSAPWEYHVLTSESQTVLFDEPLPPLTYLDHRINELAEQGWEVQSIQPVSSGRRTPEVIVLLRRPRRLGPGASGQGSEAGDRRGIGK